MSASELKKLVAQLLRQQLRTRSKVLIEAVVKELRRDPHLRSKLARIEARGLV